MICHCGETMYVEQDRVLKKSGMRKTRMKCMAGHRLSLLEGVPVGNLKTPRLECALNARGASSEQIEIWRHKASLRASSTRRTGTEPLRGPESAEILDLQSWALQMRGAHGSLVSVKHKKMRNGCAGSSTENHRNNPPALAGKAEERRAA